MEKETNEILMRNVALLSKQTEQETSMMPQTDAPLPSVEQVRQIVCLVKSMIFPDYFTKRQSTETINSYFIGVKMMELLQLLTKQIAHGMQFCEDSHIFTSKEQVYELANKLALQFIDTLPEIKRLLYTDVQAMFDNDPAALNYGEVIFCYPVVQAMTHYRIAHKLIGEYFAIDHGTGVVIGETSIIGNHVTLYQGVTLGSKNFKHDEQGNILNVPRHPIIEDYVTVYSNASILGRITIGHHSIIGGNIWVTHNVAPNSRIQQSKAVESHYEGGLGI